MPRAADLAEGSTVGSLLYRFRSAAGEHALVAPHTRIFDLLSEVSDEELAATARALAGEESLDALAEPAPQSLSLNVSSSCNLSCSYCYAARGGFNGLQSAPMAWDTARVAIDRLLAVADPMRPITIGFLGGEPFGNGRLIHQAVRYTSERACAQRLDVRYSVTTNATLLKAEDLELLRSHAFAVTVSVDGDEPEHDLNRPRHSDGRGSWADALKGIAPLLAHPGTAKVAARATAVRGDIDIARWVERLCSRGFPEVGVSPLRVSGAKGVGFGEADWPVYLERLVDAARIELGRAQAGAQIRLTNFAVALKQLHRGASSPYPCGAGGGYFSVSSQGDWYACHRAIGDDAYRLGSNGRLDERRRRMFLAERHVHSQAPCRSCWARYLCSGGCHHEAQARTEASCDFIRGWLTFCLQTYCEIGGTANPVARLFDREGLSR